MQHAATLNGSAVNINNKLKQMGVNSQMEMQDSLDGGSPGKSSSNDRLVRFTSSHSYCHNCYLLVFY